MAKKMAHNREGGGDGARGGGGVGVEEDGPGRGGPQGDEGDRGPRTERLRRPGGGVGVREVAELDRRPRP